MFKLLLKIFLSLSLGIILTLFIAQNDSHLQHYLARQFATQFEQSLDCKLFYEVQNVNLFIPRLTLKNVYVYPHDQKEWHWHAKEYATSFSWFHFLCNGTLNLQIELNRLNISSTISCQSFALWSHILKMIEGPTQIPLFVKTINVKKAQATFIDTAQGTTYKLAWNSQARKIGDITKSQTQIISGSVQHNKHLYTHNLNGSLSFDVNQENPHKTIFAGEIKASTTINPGFAPPLSAYISGTWNPDDSISASMKTSDSDLLLHSLSFKPFAPNSPLQFNLQTPLSYAQFFFKHPLLASIKGISNITVSTQLPDYEKEFKAHGTTVLPLIGSLEWNAQRNLDGSCNLEICNKESLSLFENQFSLPAQNARLNLKGTWPEQIQGALQILVKKSDTESLDLATMIDYQDSVIRYQAQHEDFELHGIYPVDQIKSANGILDYRGQPVIIAQPSANGGISANSSVAQLQPLFKRFLGYEIDGQGIIESNLWYENNLIKGSFELTQGALRIPYTYNHINHLTLQTAYDGEKQIVHIKECVAQLYKGSVAINGGSLALSSLSDQASWHLPLLFDSCLLTLQRGMFAIISGSLFNEKKPGKMPSLKGHIIIDRAQLNEHLLSAQWLRSLIAMVPRAMHENSPDIACDITLETKEPIRVKTDMLQTQAIIKLQIKGTLLKPEINGTIQLHGGQFSLSYKPLYITKALLTFDPHNVYDPHIELVAKNNIKKHNITLQIIGSLHHPHIMLESSPPLTDDQIVNLLVTGTQEKSIGAAIPTLILQSLKKLIFGEQTTVASEHIHRLLKPLNRVHLIPRFADQTARGGLRAAVEVDITDRLSVLLQKNFNVLDDTRLEVEYMLSDDISLRGVRDERKDVTGEFEMKWKF